MFINDAPIGIIFKENNAIFMKIDTVFNISHKYLNVVCLKGNNIYQKGKTYCFFENHKIEKEI